MFASECVDVCVLQVVPHTYPVSIKSAVPSEVHECVRRATSPPPPTHPDAEVFKHYVVLDIFILIVVTVYSVLCFRSIIDGCILTKVRKRPPLHIPCYSSPPPILPPLPSSFTTP